MATDTPRAWLGCLAAYNEGKLHGEWVDATDADELQTAQTRILASSPVPNAEEPYVGDYDGFGDVGRMLGEYPDMATVANVGALIEEFGEPFLMWVGTLDYDADLGELTADDFHDHYRGAWDSEEAYAMEQCCSEIGLSGLEASQVDEIASYIDWEMVARDVFFRHGSHTFVNGHVFEEDV